MNTVKGVCKYTETQLLFLSPGDTAEQMAMLGNNKGMHLKYRGKPFGLLVLLALSAAVFGVMTVHKLREKRALSILLVEKDRELYDLQAQEIHGKAKQIKDMIYTLSTQKRDQDARIMEMESTISSMKDEHQALVMTLEDRANEIKILHEKEIALSKKESEETSLREIIGLKEAEIQDLTRRLDSITQSKHGQQKNSASPDKKEKSENAGGNQENNSNGSQDQQQAVNREEMNATGDQGVEESSEISAQAMRHGGVQMSRKRLTRSRAIVRNRRMGKRQSRSTVRNTGEEQTQRGNGGAANSRGDSTKNHDFTSPGFGSADDSDKIQDTVSKAEILPEKSAEANENHQNTQMGIDVASTNVDEVKEAGENRNGEGGDSWKQPRYSDDAGSNNSEDQLDNAGRENRNSGEGDSEKQPQHFDDAELNNSEDQVDSAGGEKTIGEGDDSGKYSYDAGSNNSKNQIDNVGGKSITGEGDDPGTQPQYSDDAVSNNSENHVINAGSSEPAIEDGSSPTLTKM
ncbi:hypothetical protein MLD38_015796 [Melastoma candidum]|uniref:Uncharacterized protein n=2 Tax=Melastoma candidum TaxID=119954 RepID=A0ACB9RGK5_9MYRT|nr:hypothetical protein MLD38_015796 [Melastoma candidum]